MAMSLGFADASVLPPESAEALLLEEVVGRDTERVIERIVRCSTIDRTVADMSHFVGVASVVPASIVPVCVVPASAFLCVCISVWNPAHGGCCRWGIFRKFRMSGIPNLQPFDAAESDALNEVLLASGCCHCQPVAIVG